MDVEKFIQCVKNRPILYDRRHKQYKNIAVKNKVWESIAREMNETSDMLRIKWKGLKDGYTKYRKQSDGTPGSSVYAKMYYNWCWAKHLKFLEICAKRKTSKPNVPIPTLDDSRSLDSPSSDPPVPPVTPPLSTTRTESSPLGIQICYLDSPESLQLEHVSESMPSTSTQTHTTLLKPLRSSPNSYIRNIKTKRSSSHTFVNEDEDNVQRVQHQQAKSADAIDLLFKSYAETFKDFSVRTQVALKLKLAKLFADAEIENENLESSIEFVSPIYSIAKAESEHDYALAQEHSTLHHQETTPQNAVAFEVVQESELSSLLKKSPVSDSSNDSQRIDEEYFV